MFIVVPFESFVPKISQIRTRERGECRFSVAPYGSGKNEGRNKENKIKVVLIFLVLLFV